MDTLVMQEFCPVTRSFPQGTQLEAGAQVAICHHSPSECLGSLQSLPGTVIHLCMLPFIFLGIEEIKYHLHIWVLGLEWRHLDVQELTQTPLSMELGGDQERILSGPEVGAGLWVWV